MQPAELVATLKSTDWQWALLGLVLACLANLACSLRWRKIVVQLGQPLEKSSALQLYFQGITANTVLPGGIIGGDIWRVLGLAKMGMSKTSATQSVVLDRAIGFWALSTLALLALLIQFVSGQIASIQAPQVLAAAYVMALLAMSLSPGLLWWMKAKWVRGMLVPASISVGSQLLTITAFLCCLTAVRAEFSSLAVATLCAGIFLGAVVPASIGGFGSRELASVFFLAGLGIQPEAAFLASVLFGLTATAQGLLALPSWLTRERREESLKPRN
ncbi:MAG: UPF0104 family protein [Oxalobacteraceae bacterium]|nr:UPF0104 family protein [Oxalobacteraceae bacterium]